MGGCRREIFVSYIGRGIGGVIGICCEGEGEVGYGDLVCRWVGGCLVSLSGVGGLWG